MTATQDAVGVDTVAAAAGSPALAQPYAELGQIGRASCRERV